MRNVAIVTNMWNLVDKRAALARENELKTDELFFKTALDNGAKMYRHDNTAASARSILKGLFRKRMTSLTLQKELAAGGKDIYQTSAGRVVQDDVAALTQKHERELQEIREEMARALAEHDTVASRELSESREDIEKSIRAIQQKKEGLPGSFMRATKKAEEDLRNVYRHGDGDGVATSEERVLGPRCSSPGPMDTPDPSGLSEEVKGENSTSPPRAGFGRRGSTMILKSAGRLRRATTSFLGSVVHKLPIPGKRSTL